MIQKLNRIRAALALRIQAKKRECAEYYGYEFKAHDSIEDVKATLHCYRKLTEQRQEHIVKIKKRVEVKNFGTLFYDERRETNGTDIERH